MPRVVIVGAGPAGIAAAHSLVGQGADVTLIEEGRRPGGQAYRTPTPGLDLPIESLLGSEAENHRRVHAMFAALDGRIDYRPETLAWNACEGQVNTLSGGVLDAIAFDALVIATGATDRILPIPGWTLPGVYTLGGAQVVLKDQGCLIGRQVVFCGSSPLLYLAALQYARMGAEVVAVLDTTPFSEKLRAWPDLLAAPRTLLKGLGHLAALRRLGVPVRHGARPIAFTGTGAVDGVVWRDGQGAEQRVSCDAVAFGFGLRPESQLAELAGSELRYDPVFRQWFPVHDVDGRCGGGIYVAGDCCRVGGAIAAEESGHLVAHAVLADLGIGGAAHVEPMRSTVAAMERFQRGLARAFAWPHRWIAELGDDVVICRCEGVTAGLIRRTVANPRGGERELNRVKAASRCGMGRCQGRFCGLASAELVAACREDSESDLDRLRAQPPVKPIPVSAVPREMVS